MQSNYPPQGNVPPPPYGGQQPYGQPMPPQTPTKKRKPWLWIIALVVVFFVGYGIGSAGHSDTATTTATTTQTASTVTTAPTSAPAQPTTPPKPTAVPKLTTILNLTGNGQKKTAVFTVPDDWKISYTCQAFNDGTGMDGSFAVTVYGADNSIIDPGAVDVTCKNGKTTSDSTEEHQGGQVYLSISGTGDWTLQVQAVK
jgi:hypothetical protein